MATPTFTAIDPVSCHPGGKELVRITGTDFELPPAVPVTGYVGGSSPETVQVEIDGRLCTDVKVWTAQELTCLTPAFRGDPGVLNADPGYSVDVTIRNLGPPIEEATFTDEFAYKRPDFTRGDSALKHVVRTVVRELRRQVLNNTVMATSVDYDGDTGDGADIVEIAQIPSLALFGPNIQEDTFRRESVKPVTQNIVSLEYTKTRIPRISILSFEMTVSARSFGEMLQLNQEIVDFFSRNPLIEIDQDTTDPSAGVYGFDMYLTAGPSRSGTANASDVYSATASFEIHGVPIDSDEGTQVNWGTLIDDPDTDVTISSEGLE